MEHLPPWLRNLPLPPPPPSRRGVAEPAPDWLRGVAEPAPPPQPTRGAAPAVGGAGEDVPDWLKDLQAESAAQPPPTSGSTTSSGEDVPDWLKDLEREQADQPPSTSGPPKPFGATAWLSNLSQGGEGGQPPEPPPTTSQSSDSWTTTSSRIKMPVGATDWLRSIGEEPDERAEVAKPAPQPPAPEPAAEVPDWLLDISPDDLAQDLDTGSEPAPPPPAPPADPSAMPVFDPSDWLTGDESVTAAEPTVGADWLFNDSSAETMLADDQPDWAAGTAPASPAAQPEPSIPSWLASEAGEDDDMPDWLSGPGRAGPAQPTPSQPTTVDDDVPDWLRDAEAAQPQRPQPPARPAPPAADDAPDWLTGGAAPPRAPIGPPADEVPDWLTAGETPAPPEPPIDDVPDWLTGGAAPPRAPVSPAAADDVPNWLIGGDAPAAPASPAADDDVPAWLLGAEATPSRPAQPQPSQEETPDWLRDPSSLSAPVVPPPGLRPPPQPAADEVPTWLQGDLDGPLPPPSAPADDVPPWLRGEDGPPAMPASDDMPPWLANEQQSVTGSVTPGDLGLPSWLRGDTESALAPDPPAAPRAPAPVPPPSTPPQRQSSSWLFGDDDSTTSTSSRSGGGVDDLLGGADLPRWLRQPEPEAAAPAQAAQDLGWLQRLGADQEEEVEQPVAARQAVVVPRPTFTRSPDQLEAIALLDRLVRSPFPEPAPVPAPAPPGRWERIGVDRALYVLLALLLLIALIVPGLTAPFQAPPPAAGAAPLAEVVAGLGEEDVVLLAYEWDAQRSSEMRPLEQAVTRHLIERRAKLILVSTDPQGTLLSFDLIEPMRAAGYNQDASGANFGGRDYVLLGFRPGGELALRSMASDLRAMLSSDFEGRDATQGALATNFDGTPRVSTIADLALIVVMADQPQDVQVWAEQIHSRAPAVPMAFLMPSEIQPQVRPYLRQSNILGVAGLSGAFAYSAGAGQGDPADLARRIGQEHFATVLFVALLVVGVASQAVARRRKGKQQGSA